ncbi:hypothetical protein W97_02524 [Coniosporium apollinis CBS 100218]|uniref:Uncharacterized protein n=1 Tax=Coniosporium apollinis (strain CBS 100218) TaxID=1168221 RepID=R7YN20_CONA1|nr:uncharacterized protein W97_02524 [Coniosporium apollinis CBS 100218]EON63297.1 hypothetical protein W97_02524 [Coniosporium apollinis CBS 100218]
MFVGQPVHRVALLEEPTLLYKAPSQRLYVFVSLASAATFIVCGLWMYKYIYLEVRDLHWYTGFAYFAMVVMLIALALNYGLASRGLVKSITAVPVQRNRQPRLDLRIEIQRLVPILKSRILEVPVENVSQPVQGTLRLLVIDVAYRKELYRRAKLGPKNEPMFIKPFTRLGRFLSRNALRFFQYNQAVAGGLGFSPLYVKGERFQLKIDGSGWFLEDGKVLDQIVRSSR